MADISKIKSYLVISQPFFASILLRHPLKETKLVPTACITPKGEILYCKEFVERLSDKECIFLLVHEVMHLVYMHHIRGKGKDQRKWNYACDAVINDYLKDLRIGEMIDGGVDMPGARDKTAEEVYASLPDEPEGFPAPGGQPGKKDGHSTIGGIGQDLPDPSQVTDSDIAQQKADIQIEVIEAAKEAKNMGKMPGGMDRIIDGLFTSKTPWYELLERFFTSASHQDISWSRPNRRYLDAYLPSSKPMAGLGTIVVGVDTSGSIGTEELAEFQAHLNSIMELCRPEKVYVVYADAEINRVDEFTSDDLPVRMTPCGGGGTHMPVIIEWIDENGIDPDVCCILTDGYTGFADSAFPTVWCMTTDMKSPYGTTIKLEVSK